MAYENNKYDERALTERETPYPIHPILLARNSPDEMTGEQMSDEELFPLFEAMRWAPSSRNRQPWRVIYAKRNTTFWPQFLQLLWPPNIKWAQNASVLAAIVSSKKFKRDGKLRDSRSHSFDCGSAWISMALEGTARDYVVHAMGGIYHDRAYETLKLSEDTHFLNTIVAIGKRPPVGERTAEDISQRRPINELIFEGEFDFSEGFIVKHPRQH